MDKLDNITILTLLIIIIMLGTLIARPTGSVSVDCQLAQPLETPLNQTEGLL